MSEKNEDKPTHVEVVTEKSLQFFEKYINNPSPTGFEYPGQKMWLEYLEPYIDESFIDTMEQL